MSQSDLRNFLPRLRFKYLEGSESFSETDRKAKSGYRSRR